MKGICLATAKWKRNYSQAEAQGRGWRQKIRLVAKRVQGLWCPKVTHTAVRDEERVRESKRKRERARQTAIAHLDVAAVFAYLFC